MCSGSERVREQHHVGQREQRQCGRSAPAQAAAASGASSPSRRRFRPNQPKTSTHEPVSADGAAPSEVEHHARDVLGRHVRLRARACPTRSMSVSTEPGADGVDGDAVGAQLLGQRARQADDAVLGGAVGGEPRRPLAPGDRRDVDDAAARRARACPGRNARVTRKVPLRLASTTSSQVSTDSSSRRAARHGAGVVHEQVRERRSAPARRPRSARPRRRAARRRPRRRGAACSAQPATVAPRRARRRRRRWRGRCRATRR